MARSILDIVIRLSKQGGADRETVKGLVQVKSSLAQVMGIAGAATGVLLTAKKAFDFAKEGAQLQFVEQRFNRLSTSIGANASLMGELRSVTRGLYSDTQLMTSAGDLMGLGLAKNSDELLRLSNVAAGLNMNMNQLVLTLTNKTMMRFDQLNVSTDGFKEKLADLQAAGMSADDAFKEAFLQQAEMQLEKVGEAADSTAGAFMRFDAQTANAFDRLKKNAADAFAPLVSGMADSLEGFNSLNEAIDEFGSSHLAEAVRRAATEHIPLRDAIADVAREYQNATNYGLAWERFLQGQTGVTQTATDNTFDFGESMTRLNDIMGSGGLGSAYEDYQQTLSDIRREQADIQTELDKWTAPPEGSKKYQELIDKQVELEEKANAVTEAYQRQAAAISFSVAQQQIGAAVEMDPSKALEGSQLLNLLANDYGLIDERQRQLMDSSAVLINQWAQGNNTMAETAIGLEGLGTRLSEVDLVNRQMTTAISMSGEELRNNVAKYGEMGELAVIAREGSGGLGEEMVILSSEAETGAKGLGLVNQEMDTTKSLANDGIQAVTGLADEVGALDGLHATVYIDIIVTGEVPRFGKGGSVGGYQNVAQCFVAGTPVTLADRSQKPIETVRAGDQVLSYDPDAGEFLTVRVRAAHHHDLAPVILVINEHMRVTPEHKIYTRDRGWQAAGRLLVGDTLLDHHGGEIAIVSIRSEPGGVPVYNLTTDHETHDYFAAGWLVHNGKAAGGGFATGGQLDLAGWNVVGDRPGGVWTDTTELVGPGGVVIPNQMARYLMATGLVPANLPSFGYDPGTSGLQNVAGAHGAQTIGRRVDNSGSVAVTTGGTDRSGEYVTPTQTFTETVTPLVETTQQAVQSVEAAQVTQAFEARQTRAAMQSQNAEQTAILREINSSINQLNSRITTSMRAAIAQAGL